MTILGRAAGVRGGGSAAEGGREPHSGRASYTGGRLAHAARGERLCSQRAGWPCGVRRARRRRLCHSKLQLSADRRGAATSGGLPAHRGPAHGAGGRAGTRALRPWREPSLLLRGIVGRRYRAGRPRSVKRARAGVDQPFYRPVLRGDARGQAVILSYERSSCSDPQGTRTRRGGVQRTCRVKKKPAA